MQPQVIHISEFTSNKELALMFVENYCLSQIEEMFQKKHPIKNLNLDFFAVADSENNLIIASPEVYVKTGIKSSLQIEDTRHKELLDLQTELRLHQAWVFTGPN